MCARARVFWGLVIEYVPQKRIFKQIAKIIYKIFKYIYIYIYINAYSGWSRMRQGKLISTLSPLHKMGSFVSKSIDVTI